MSELVLVTGGAGFIGTALSRNLLGNGFKVRILDNFSPQIHSSDQIPRDLAPNVELVKGDVRDKDLLASALQDVDVVVHLAAETGTGQSMYEVSHYFDVNVQATANLVDLLINKKAGQKVRSLIVASSRAIYGEGAYRCASHGVVYPEPRTLERLEAGLFDPICPKCGKELHVDATEESAVLSPMSIYAMTKLAQEQTVLLCARACNINGYALRYQNVYGPGQSLKNPYTGILAVFSNLARQGKNIEIYEDGLESRDFVYIDDVVEATARAVASKDSFVGSLNVGSGIGISVNSVAQSIKQYFGVDIDLVQTGAYRIGDIRHNFASSEKLRDTLGFEPKVKFQDGLKNFLDWASEQVVEDASGYERSRKELADRGLLGRA